MIICLLSSTIYFIFDFRSWQIKSSWNILSYFGKKIIMIFFKKTIKTVSWFTILLFLLVSFLSPSILFANTSSKQVKIGVLAKRGPEKAMDKWGPTAHYLTKTIQTHDFIIVPLNFEEVHASIVKAEIDFIVTNSAYYVLLVENHGLSRIATL